MHVTPQTGVQHVYNNGQRVCINSTHSTVVGTYVDTSKKNVIINYPVSSHRGLFSQSY